jgi:hypothetical protein
MGQEPLHVLPRFVAPLHANKAALHVSKAAKCEKHQAFAANARIGVLVPVISFG